MFSLAIELTSSACEPSVIVDGEANGPRADFHKLIVPGGQNTAVEGVRPKLIDWLPLSLL